MVLDPAGKGEGEKSEKAFQRTPGLQPVIRTEMDQGPRVGQTQFYQWGNLLIPPANGSEAVKV